jgi:hypothetical protein
VESVQKPQWLAKRYLFSFVDTASNIHLATTFCPLAVASLPWAEYCEAEYCDQIDRVIYASGHSQMDKHERVQAFSYQQTDGLRKTPSTEA